MMKTFFYLSIILLLSAASSEAQLSSTGWKRPTAVHFPNDWTNPQNAFGSDDTYAEVLHQSGCRCPFLDMSWDNGNNYSSYNIFGPYGTNDSFRNQGDSMDGWGHVWTDAELDDTNFVLRIWNSSTLLKQGYSNFGFGIPAGSTISGIEVRVEARGDSAYFMDYVDIIEVNVFYMLPTRLNDAYGDARHVQVFPNPAREMINLKFFDQMQPQKIQIVNTTGSLQKEITLQDALTNETYPIDVSDLLPGIYFMYIESGGKSVVARFVIQ